MLSKFQFYDPETITENCNKNKQELPNKSAILRSLDSLTNITALDKDKTEPTECRILSPHWIEYLLIFWVFSFTCQELTQVSVPNKSKSCKTKWNYFKLLPSGEEKFLKNFSEYITDGWNQFDLLGIFLFVLGMLLRYISLSGNEDVFIASRQVKN